MGYRSIAIDGPSAAGKSTLARRLAKMLGYLYVDTGAIYRTVALKVKLTETDAEQETAVAAILDTLNVHMAYDEGGQQRMYLDGEDVSDMIRMHEISELTSKIAGYTVVRNYLLEFQRAMARENNVVMDGRDIGTVVLPDADVKIFLTASAETRAMRRYRELVARGTEVAIEQLVEDVKNRDKQDENREIAPLRQAEDAVLLDTTLLGFDESLGALIQIVEERLGK